MTPEVRERIEQIRHGIVPEGYKEAATGIVPIEWKYVSIADVGTIITGSTPPTDNPEYYTGNKLFITPADFNSSIYITKSERTVSEDAYTVSRVIPANSIYVVCIGATVGKINMCATEAICNQQINAIVPKQEESNQFIYYCIDYFFNRIKKKHIGEQTLPIVSKGQFSRIQLVLPAFNEQLKIAEVLTAQDKVIELKEQLLTEKQRQKKYLMQQLLTGKKRLHGFDGERKRVKLGSIAERIVQRNDEGNENILTISAQHGLISQSEFFKKEIASDDKSNYFLLHKDDFAYNKSYSTGYPLGATKRLNRYDKGIVSPLYICFRIVASDASIGYVEQYFEAGLMNRKIQAFAQEGARNHGLLNIAVNDFFNMDVDLPSIEEQLGIVAILEKSDQEIELLRQNIEQEKQKKKALMQLLLTGIVRVKGE